MGFFRFKRFLTSRRIRVFYVVGLVLIGLLAFFFVFPEGIMDGDVAAVVLGLVIGILGPIPLRLACERGIILGRIDEHLEMLAKLESPEGEPARLPNRKSAKMGFNLFDIRFEHILTSGVSGAFYVIGMVVIGLLALILVVSGIVDGDAEAVALGLVLGILGPISSRLTYERRVILGRVDERLAFVVANRQELPPPTGLIEGSVSDMDSSGMLTAEKAERISEEEAPELISPPEGEGQEGEEGKAAAGPIEPSA